MSWKARGISYGRADDNVGSCGYADYSRAGNTTRLELTICHSNPMEKKIYETLCKSIDQRKKQREASLYHNQRLFFIQQVFEKGLNPYLKRGESDTEDIPEENDNAEVEPDPPKEEQPQEEATGPADVQTRPRSSSLPVLRRSVTMALVDNSKTDTSQQTQDKLPGLERSKTVITALDLKKPAPGASEEGKISVGVLPKIQIGQNDHAKEKKEKQSILKLRPVGAKPSDLGLKTPRGEQVNKIQFSGKVEQDTEPPRPQTDRKAPPAPLSKQVSFLRSQSRKGTADQQTQEKSEETIKLIQKLTTYLPPHLADTAKTQIRQMSNSDAIYDCKQRLLEKNRISLESRSTADPRWEKLEGALSESFGGVKWRKVAGRTSWIPYKETLQ